MEHSKTRTAKLNRILLACAAVLLALSAFTYHDSVSRADRFERGQKFLQSLNPDEIAEIVLREGAGDGGGGSSEVVLRRTASGDRFVVQSEAGYRADNAEVNRLLRQLLEMELEKEVGAASASLSEELGLAESDGVLPDGTVEVTLRNAAEKDMVRVLVGEEFTGDGPTGNYLRRADDDGKIYLSRGRINLNVDGGAYVDKEIADVPRTEIAAIRGDGFALVRTEEGGALELQDLPEGKKESSKASGLKGVLSPLRFQTHHLADAAEVRGLEFGRRLRVELDDGSGYVLELARAGATESDSDDVKAYLRVSGFHTTEQVYIEQDASEEDVKETSEVLVRADEIADFNEYHGSWIYEVTDTVADRIDVGAADLQQDG